MSWIIPRESKHNNNGTTQDHFIPYSGFTPGTPVLPTKPPLGGKKTLVYDFAYIENKPFFKSQISISTRQVYNLFQDLCNWFIISEGG